MDGGGTSTTAWLADAEGNVLGRGPLGPVQHQGRRRRRRAERRSTSRSGRRSPTPGSAGRPRRGLLPRPGRLRPARGQAMARGLGRRVGLGAAAGPGQRRRPRRRGRDARGLGRGRDRRHRLDRRGPRPRRPDGPRRAAGATSSATRGAPSPWPWPALRRVARRADGREPIGAGGRPARPPALRGPGDRGDRRAGRRRSTARASTGPGSRRWPRRSSRPMEEDPRLLAEILEPAGRRAGRDGRGRGPQPRHGIPASSRWRWPAASC